MTDIYDKMSLAKEKAKGMLKQYLESQGINTDKHFTCLSVGHTDSNPSMIFNEKTNTVYCFGCGEHGDIFDVIRMQYNISKTDYKTIFETTYKILGIDNDYQGLKNKRSLSNLTKKETQILEEKKETDYSSYFQEAESRINETNYAAKRGLTEEVIKKFHIGFDPAWINPKLDVEAKKKIPPSPRLIIPTSNHSYLARNTKENLKEYEKKYAKIKVGKVRIFNKDALKKSTTPIFVVEGEIDALSLIVAGGEAVALGSASNIKLCLRECKTNPPQVPLILCADNDEIGKKAMENLGMGLLKLKISFSFCNINKNYKDANDRLINDFDGLKKDVASVNHLFYTTKIKNCIKHKNFYNAYAYTISQNNNIVNEKIQLNFMENIIKIFGRDIQILQSATEAVTKFERESPKFTAKLLSETMQIIGNKLTFNSNFTNENYNSQFVSNGQYY